jgi:hypothetical protein
VSLVCSAKGTRANSDAAVWAVQRYIDQLRCRVRRLHLCLVFRQRVIAARDTRDLTPTAELINAARGLPLRKGKRLLTSSSMSDGHGTRARS